MEILRVGRGFFLGGYISLVVVQKRFLDEKQFLFSCVICGKTTRMGIRNVHEVLIHLDGRKHVFRGFELYIWHFSGLYQRSDNT